MWMKITKSKLLRVPSVGLPFPRARGATARVAGASSPRRAHDAAKVTEWTLALCHLSEFEAKSSGLWCNVHPRGQKSLRNCDLTMHNGEPAFSMYRVAAARYCFHLDVPMSPQRRSPLTSPLLDRNLPLLIKEETRTFGGRMIYISEAASHIFRVISATKTTQ